MSNSPRHRRPMIEAIEPRLLFSATADIAVFDDGSHVVNALMHAANNLDLTQVYFQADNSTYTNTPLALEAPQAISSPAPVISETHSIVFIDTSVSDYKTLVNDILNNPDNKNIELVYLNPDQDGITQITNALKNYTQVTAIHIVSHGAENTLEIGNQDINNANISNYATQLTTWKTSLTADADILLYGCDITATAAGLNFIEQISQLTGADVAASNNSTGKGEAGGDWVLETHSGAIETTALLHAQQDTTWAGALANNAPTVANALTNQSVRLNSALSYQFASNIFNDVDGDTLTYSALRQDGSGLPAWLSFDAATRTFSGTPVSINDLTNFTIRVTADDGNGSTVYDDFVITVSHKVEAESYTNSFGVSTEVTTDTGGGLNVGFISSGDFFLYAGSSGNQLTAYSGVYTIDWRLASPSGGQFQFKNDVFSELYDTVTVPNTGGYQTWTTVTRTATLTQRDEYVIYIPTTGDFNLNWFELTPNDAPTVSRAIADQSATEGSLFSFQFASHSALNNVFDDTNGLTYTATQADGSALPVWLAFDATTRTFSGTADDGDVGVKNIRVTATDIHGDSVSDTFALTVTNVQEAPVVNIPIPDQNATGYVPFSYSFPANSARDPDIGDTLTYSAQLSGGGALPAWLSYDANTRTFSGTPTNAEVGVIAIDVIATDSANNTVTDTFDLTVATGNTPPVNSVPGAQITNEDIPLVFNIGNGNQIQISDVDAAGGNVEVTLGITNGALTLGGIANLIFTTGDGTSDTSMVFSGTVADINIALATITYTPTTNYFGASTLSITTNDLGNTGAGGAHSDADTVAITINSVNDAPTIANAIPNQNATEDAAFNFQFAANTFDDQDIGDTLAYTSQLSGGGALPAWLSFDATTRTFSGTPANANVGTLNIDVIASDGNGGTVTDTFAIVIANTNDAPTIANAIPNQNATEDAAFNFQFAANTFNDQDLGDTLAYTSQLSGGGALPAWLSFDPLTRTFSGTPANADVGTLNIEVIADDGNGGTVTDTFALVIANSNDAPTIANAIPNQNATEDAAFNFQFAANTFSDQDLGDTLAYTSQLSGGGALPAWLSFDPLTRTFSGTPANGDVGTLNIEVIADDGNGGTVTDTFAIVIANTNDAPTIANAIPNQNATEDAAFNFQFAANTFSDQDLGDTLAYTSQLSGGGALPAWLSFDAVTRTFSGTPANGDVGTLNIEVIADDGNGSTVTDTFSLVIANSNDAPTIANAIPNQNATEDAAFNFQFAANTFSDQDLGDTLAYTSQLSGGGALPAWLSFDPLTRTFSGTPANGDVGTLNIEVIADDGNGGTVTDTFAIVIANTNDAPTIANAIPNQNATEDAAFNFQFAANTFSDQDLGDTLAYTSQLSGGGALPAWLSFDAVTRTFSGTPANGDVGTLNIEVIADDGNGGTVTDTFSLVIANSNDAPTIANAIPNQNATEDAAFNFQFAANTFNDQDLGDTLAYTSQLSGGGALPGWLSFDAVTRTFSGTPANGDVGTLTIDVIADDGNGGTVTDTFAIVIANANDAPTIANPIANQNATEDAAFNFQFAANTFNDQDLGDTLAYTSQLSGGGALPAWLSFDAVTRTFSGTPANGDVGTLTIDVIADDGNGGTVTDTFALVIGNMNNPPTIANPLPDQNATEDAAFNFQFAVNTFNDADVSDTLVYSSTLNGGGALPAWLIFDAATRTFSGTPTNADVGVLTIDVSASDGNGGTVTDTFALVIANTNDAPTVATIIPNQNATEDSAFNFQFAANTFSDQDLGDTLAYTTQLNGGGALPAWLIFDTATRTFSGTPTNADVGTLNIDVTASDGNGGTVTDTFVLVIGNINNLPTIANSLPDQTATEDTAFNFQFSANTFNDADVSDTFIYSSTVNGGSALPAWLTFNADTRTFSGTPTNADVGTLTLNVTASDGHGGTITDTFVLVIANTNDAPTLTNSIPNQTAKENNPFTFTPAPTVFNDVDTDDILTYSAHITGTSSLPAWLTFNANTQTFSGTPSGNDIGSISIDLVATDLQGQSATVTFMVIITAENQAPTTTGISNLNTFEDNSNDRIDLFSAFSDRENQPSELTFSLINNSNTTLVKGATIDAQTGKLLLTYGANEFGSSQITLRASDAQGLSVDTTFSINVAPVNDIPVSIGINNILIDQGIISSTINLSPLFNDIEDAKKLNYSIVENTNPTLTPSIQFNVETGIATLTYNPNLFGDTTITLRATDKDGGFVDTSFSLTITEKTTTTLPNDSNSSGNIITKPPTTTPSNPVSTQPTPPPTDNSGDVTNPTEPPDTTPTNTASINTPQDTIVSNQTVPAVTDLMRSELDAPLEDPSKNFDQSRYDRIAQQQEILSKKNSDSLNTRVSISALIAPGEGFSTADTEEFSLQMRKINREMDNIIEDERQQQAMVAGITLSLTTGILIWSLRASSLLLTLMSMLPLWRGIDPLPILDEVKKRKEELEQQRKDKKTEDKNANEVGYLFDHIHANKTKE